MRYDTFQRGNEPRNFSYYTHITMILLAFQQFRSFTHWVSALRDRLHGSGGVVGDHCEIPVPVGNCAPEPTRLVIAREP